MLPLLLHCHFSEDSCPWVWLSSPSSTLIRKSSSSQATVPITYLPLDTKDQVRFPMHSLKTPEILFQHIGDYLRKGKLMVH